MVLGCHLWELFDAKETFFKSKFNHWKFFPNKLPEQMMLMLIFPYCQSNHKHSKLFRWIFWKSNSLFPLYANNSTHIQFFHDFLFVCLLRYFLCSSTIQLKRESLWQLLFTCINPFSFQYLYEKKIATYIKRIIFPLRRWMHKIH